MSTAFYSPTHTVIADIRTKQTSLERYKSERDAATAWIQRLQANRGATKEDWLEFSKRICVAADRYLNAAAD
jgi:hypothetical protein